MPVLQLRSGICYSYSHDRQENSLYRLDRLEEMANAGLGELPSTREALLEALDRTNSYLTANDQHRVALSFDGRYDRKTYRNGNSHARFRFTWKAGLSLQSETWDYDGQAPRRDRRTA